MTAPDPLTIPWYAHPNDVIGGWCVMPVDKPPSCGVGEVADFAVREVAEHIAALHNATLKASRPHRDDDGVHAALRQLDGSPERMYGLAEPEGEPCTD